MQPRAERGPFEDRGRLTADYLLGSSPAPEGVPHIGLPAELVVRGSTGVPV